MLLNHLVGLFPIYFLTAFLYRLRYSRGEGTRWIDTPSAALRISYVSPCESEEYDFSGLFPGASDENMKSPGESDKDDGVAPGIIAAIAVCSVLLATLIVVVIRPWSAGEVSLWSNKSVLAMSEEIPFRFDESPELHGTGLLVVGRLDRSFLSTPIGDDPPHSPTIC